AVFRDLEKIEAATARGRALFGAVSCCPLSMDFTLHSPYVIEGLDAWRPALGLKGEAYRSRLRERAFREGIRAELSRPAHCPLVIGEWENVEVVASPRRKGLVHRSIRQMAEARGKDPLVVMLGLALEDGLDTGFNAMLLN